MDPKDGLNREVLDKAVETRSPQGDATSAASVAEGLDSDDIEQLLDQATESLEQATGEEAPNDPASTPFALGDLKPEADRQTRQPIDLLGEV